MVYPITRRLLIPLKEWCVRENGLKNLPKKDAFIIVANHQKYVDPIWVIASVVGNLDRKIHFIASAKWWSILGEGVYRQWAACIPLFGPKQAYNDAKKCLNDGEIVGIFPEGYLNRGDRTPKTGAVRLAVDSGVPIVPVGIDYKKNSMFVVTINIGRLFYPDQNADVKKEIQRLMKRVYMLKNQKV